MTEPQQHNSPAVWRESAVGAELFQTTLPPGVYRVRDWLRRERLLAIFGLILLAVWANWWVECLTKDRMTKATRLALPAYHFLGLDFQHNYHAARQWLAGGNPYDGHFGAPLEAKFAYPPPVLPLFAWAPRLEVKAAVRVWTIALATMAAFGVWAAGRSRRQLGLTPVPLPLMLAAFLWSMPVLYALERGNYDLVVVVLIVAAAWGLRRESLAGDGVVGAALALAAWIKVYPGLLFLGLLALRRYRALTCGVAAGLAIGLASQGSLSQFLTNVQEFAWRDAPSTRNQLDYSVHTISGCWRFLWTHPKLAWVAQLPPLAGAIGLVLPGILWVCWQVGRAPTRPGLALPFLLWLAAVATFVPPVANDYNLLFLPLAALAVWDRRDPVLTHVLMGLLLLWWQPTLLAIGPRLLFLFKVGGVVAVGLSLATRAWEAAGTVAEGKPVETEGAAVQAAA